MKKLTAIVKKEIKELLTLRVIAPVIGIVIIFTFIGRMMKGELKKQEKPQHILVVDYDSTSLSQLVLEILSRTGIVLHHVNKKREEVIKTAKMKGYTTILFIPKGFERSIKETDKAHLELYSIMKTLSPFGTIKGARVIRSIQNLNEHLFLKKVKELTGVEDIQRIKKMVEIKEYTYIKDKKIARGPGVLRKYFSAQTFLIPMLIFIILVYATQLIAASIGQEKENKTLETLLTTPVDRKTIIAGKMIGASVIGLIMAVVVLIGMRSYVSSFYELGGMNLSRGIPVGVSISPIFYLLTGIGIFLAIIGGLALTILVSIFASDAKQAQAMTMPVIMLAMIPYLFTIIFDFNSLSLPLKIFLYLIPFTHPFLIPANIFLKEYLSILLGIAYMIIFAVVIIVVVARIFSSDVILTAKPRFRIFRK